jgi:pimeloyl-ACP methyl ester carboxylesterase
MRRLRSSDGVTVALYDLGGARTGPALLLVHGTGFCAQVFAPLAVHLGTRYRCYAIDLRGHGLTTAPEGLDYAWTGFADDVLAAAKAVEPVIGVGHSAGGAALLLAEAERPGTFSSLWCYEPIVWPDPHGARPRAEWLGGGARRRRERFASRDEAYANFRSKKPFSTLASAVLRAYVEHGFDEHPDGSVTLRCRPDIEAEIYLRGVEGDRFSRLAEVSTPVTVACGGRTEAVDPRIGRQLVDKLPSGRLEVFDSLGHFGPLEDPQTVAAAILASS